MARYLGIDTSNYTTSVSVSENGTIVQNLKIPLSVSEGERGLRQSDAVFAHTVNLPKIFEKLSYSGFDAVGVSYAPRDAEGSYMPCFLTGVSAASAVSSACKIPLYRFSHQAGHVAAALYSCNREEMMQDEFIAFHVSGGTTELLLVRKGRIELLGGTKDISAGKAVDRIGVKLGLKFPCGPMLEQICSDPSKSKIGKLSVKGFECNLSGIENKADKMIEDGVKSSDIAAYTIAFITETISKMTENALSVYSGLPVVYSGGVMSNKYIAGVLSKRFGGSFAAPEFSCDNAAGIARLTEIKHLGS